MHRTAAFFGTCLLTATHCCTAQLAAPPGGGGGRIAGAGIEAWTSTGDAIEGGVTVAGPVRHSGGYTGQLYDPVALQLTATPTTTVPEGLTRQLNAITLLDDNTFLATAQPAWSILGGPLTSVSATGLATAGIVYNDSPATVRATANNLSATILLTVLNANPDNFGAYAGDGIDDDWQVALFGLNNPLAAPLADPDSDGQSNLFEFLAKVNPLDPFSVFTVRLQQNPVNPNRHDIVFKPVFADRTYTLLASPGLNPGGFTPVTNTSTVTGGSERTITVNTPATVRTFYRVQIAKP